MKRKIIISITTLGASFIVCSILNLIMVSDVEYLLAQNVKALAAVDGGARECHERITSGGDVSSYYCGTCSWIKNSEGSRHGSCTPESD